jgi:hypothetical protein
MRRGGVGAGERGEIGGLSIIVSKLNLPRIIYEAIITFYKQWSTGCLQGE